MLFSTIKTKLKFLVVFLTTFLFLWAGSTQAFAQVNCNPGTPGSKNTDGVNTAIGCIPVNDISAFTAWLFQRLVFVASGVAFLLLVLGAVQILTSSGNPDKVKAGGELITSAISGLLLIILSVFLLKLIGVDILHIPGF